MTTSLETVRAFDQLPEITGLLDILTLRLSPRFAGYRPHVEIDIETKYYRLKTARSMNELIQVFGLRYDVFLKAIKGDDQSFDLDEYDHICDHLIILDKDTDEVVGTYRVLCSSFVDKFYSQSEFDLSKFLSLPDVKMELGRACIHENHRNGNVIDLLWRGIGEYSKVTNSRYIFGCSSVKTVEEQTAKDIYDYLEREGKLDDSLGVDPIGKFKMDFSLLQENDDLNMKDNVPSLLRSYLSAGAKLQGEPALDIDFECIDFLTILDLENVSKAFKRRYFS